MRNLFKVSRTIYNKLHLNLIEHKMAQLIQIVTFNKLQKMRNQLRVCSRNQRSKIKKCCNKVVIVFNSIIQSNPNLNLIILVFQSFSKKYKYLSRLCLLLNNILLVYLKTEHSQVINKIMRQVNNKIQRKKLVPHRNMKIQFIKVLRR